jgi:hypothetical protein
MMPMKYLVSGGIAMRDLMPGPLYGCWGALEEILSPWIHRTAMFALIDIERR